MFFIILQALCDVEFLKMHNVLFLLIFIITHYTNMYERVCVHAHTHACINTKTRTHEHNTHIHIIISACMYKYKHAKHTYTWTQHTHTYAQSIYTHKCTHTHTPSTYTRTNVHTPMYTHSCNFGLEGNHNSWLRGWIVLTQHLVYGNGLNPMGSTQWPLYKLQPYTAQARSNSPVH